MVTRQLSQEDTFGTYSLLQIRHHVLAITYRAVRMLYDAADMCFGNAAPYAAYCSRRYMGIAYCVYGHCMPFAPFWLLPVEAAYYFHMLVIPSGLSQFTTIFHAAPSLLAAGRNAVAISQHISYHCMPFIA